jgi:hypothetical protein
MQNFQYTNLPTYWSQQQYNQQNIAEQFHAHHITTETDSEAHSRQNSTVVARSDTHISTKLQPSLHSKRLSSFQYTVTQVVSCKTC